MALIKAPVATLLIKQPKQIFWLKWLSYKLAGVFQVPKTKDFKLLRLQFKNVIFWNLTFKEKQSFFILCQDALCIYKGKITLKYEKAFL